jgi:hypothetical protein
MIRAFDAIQGEHLVTGTRDPSPATIDAQAATIGRRGRLPSALAGQLVIQRQ